MVGFKVLGLEKEFNDADLAPLLVDGWACREVGRQADISCSKLVRNAYKSQVGMECFATVAHVACLAVAQAEIQLSSPNLT